MPSIRPDPRRRHSVRVVLAFALAAALHAGTASAQSVRLLVQSSPLAGFTYHAAPAVFATLRTGFSITKIVSVNDQKVGPRSFGRKARNGQKQ